MAIKPKIDFTRFSYAIQQKMNVMNAVMLRDMRTRFFNHGLGFLVQSLWPLSHMIVLLTLYNFAGRSAPFGDSLNVFFATGLVPTLSFMYISRFMSLSVVLNKPMLSFPAVTVTDILFARALLEIIAGALTLLLIIIVLWCTGANPTPVDPAQAVLCYLSTVLLAVGVGTLAGVLVMMFELFVTVYALLCILFYISSGTLFVANQLPSSLAVPLSYSPLIQSVEWMRTAYFENYSDSLVNRGYLVIFGLTCLLLGLGLERLFRRRIMEG
ncbi:ABC transporter permease [Rhizobium lusitanum]|uniref:Capsular polysaccharide transport system permease protein n=1 Tax=Rhizobium lusitanum TaxID=293958 RepID=A0A1C3XF92_9HYPH|nr:ABC transporter permease [Rhizobium lusitanum]SCB50950.1 capsular polysaccharide transport system permease protein [Rhizobium lusitanum]